MQGVNTQQKNNSNNSSLTTTTTPVAMTTTTPITTTATVIATATEINQSNGRASEENRGGVSEKQSHQDTNKSNTISKQLSGQSVSSSVADLDKQQDEISAELSKAISSSTQRNNNKFSTRTVTEVYSDDDDEGDDDDDNEVERIGFDDRHRFNRSMYHNRTISAVDTESEIVYDDEDDDDYRIADHDDDTNENTVRFRPTVKRVGIVSSFWQPGTISRPSSPPGFITMDSTVDNPITRSHNSNLANIGSKYSNLSYWRARRVIFYKNGDPFFPGLEIRFKPGRDIVSLEALLDKLSLRLDLPRGARYIFSMDGERKLDLDELEDGASYVVSSFKTFKPASYGKKNGIWYATPSNQTWNRSSNPNSLLNNSNRKSSMIETDITNMSNTNSIKSGSGRVIRIINDVDHTIQCRILLNLRTSQPFEEVVEDLGQVLKISGANKMYTVSGQEVRGFSQLRNEFMDMDTFYIGIGAVMQASPPMRRSRSKTNITTTNSAMAINEAIPSSSNTGKQRRARSKSRPRILFAPENEIIRSSSAVTNDFTVVDVMKDEPIKISIRGMRRTFYPPLHHPPIDNSAPYKKLSLDWVYGYRGIDSKRNLWVLSTGELLYYVAAVAIMYDRDEETQRHYIGHTEDITCMDLHPSREMVVSGQKSGRSRKTQAHIRIWSTETLQTLYIFGMGDFELGVAAVAFSYLNGGSYVLTAELGKEAILSVWHWQWGHLLGKVATLQEEIYGAAFHPLDDNLLITFGRSALSFWNRRKDGFFERTDIIKPPSRTSVTCVQFEPEGDVVTGDSDGFITVYSVDSDGTYFVRMEYEAHNKGVSALIMLSEGTLLSGGERDRRISAWDSLQNYKKITDCKLPDMVGSVRNIYPQRPGRNDGNIYVGTTRNIILEGSLQRRFNPIIMGHSRQLWGLAVHPDDELFATAGHDKYVSLWKKHKQIWSTMVNFECISLAFHPFGYALAVGTIEGHLLIMNTETGNNSTTIRICGSPLNCIGYNPVGDMISIASQNGSIYLFSVSRDGFIYKKVNKMRGTQPLIQLDWSTDGCFLQTVTADYDLSFWDVKSLSPEKSAIAMKDVKWYTYNSMLGFSVAGMWNNWFYAVTALITTANRSFAHDLLVSGDSEGYLRLFRFPCISTKSEHHEQKMYSGPVVCSRFFFNDRFVASVGGSDAALMLWELISE